MPFNVRLLLGGILEVGHKAVPTTVEPLRLVLEFLGRRLLQNFRLNGEPLNIVAMRSESKSQKAASQCQKEYRSMKKIM